MPESRPRDRLLSAIVVFKFFQAALLIAVALGAHHFLSHDLGDYLDHLVDTFRIDPDNTYFQAFATKLQLLDERRLKELSVGSFFYAALVLTEGTGLAFRRRWAEYFTIIATASFLPLELYEIGRRFTDTKAVVLILNLLILLVLLRRVRGAGPGRPGESPPTAPAPTSPGP